MNFSYYESKLEVIYIYIYIYILRGGGVKGRVGGITVH